MGLPKLALEKYYTIHTHLDKLNSYSDRTRSPRVLVQGNFAIPSDIDHVWDFVSDPSKVIQCVPGLQSYTSGEGKRVSASVKFSIGFIRGNFQTNGRMVKEDPKDHTATIELTGSGAGSGFSANVNLKLAPSGKETELSWQANVNISGPLGSLAKPLIEGNLKKIVNDLFVCVKSKLT